MKTFLTPEQITAYRENGFVVLPEFLSGEELADWRQVVDDTLASSTFNRQQNVLPDAYISQLKVGHIVDNDEQNPLIYHMNKVPVMAGKNNPAERIVCRR